MKICLLAESATNPVLSSVLDTLAEHHTVTVSDPRAMALTIGGGTAGALDELKRQMAAADASEGGH